MKKMLTMAASAIAVGAAMMANAACTTGGTASTDQAIVWDFKASVKMVDGKTGSTSIKGDQCTGGTTIKDYYRVKSSRQFKGVFIDCDPCNENTLAEGETHAGIGDNLVQGNCLFYVASSANKYVDVFNSTTYSDAAFVTTAANGYEFGLLNFFGGITYAKSKYAEGTVALYFVEIDKQGYEKVYSLLAAGFGARDNYAMLKNLSGQIAGESTAAVYCGLLTQVFEPCLQTAYYSAYDAATQTYTFNTWQKARSPAYDAVTGTWSMNYNSSKSKLATKGTTASVLDKTFAKNYKLFAGTATTAPFSVTFSAD